MERERVIRAATDLIEAVQETNLKDYDADDLVAVLQMIRNTILENDSDS